MTELATTPNPTKSKTGSSLRRVEDAHLLVGKGRFTDNRPAVGQLHLHFIRSYLAHGRIVSIDKEEALQSKGVVAIYTAENLLADGIKPLPIADEFKQPDGRNSIKNLMGLMWLKRTTLKTGVRLFLSMGH